MVALHGTDDSWTKTPNHVFWGEIAPCDHVVQIYENDDSFLDLLGGFVSGGVNSGDSVIVLATPSHIEALEQRLISLGLDVKALVSTSQYIPLDAEYVLSKFMVNGWPDENLFNYVVGELIVRAKQDGRSVRAFGEMVAVLWAKGMVGATVRLEQLWNKFCESEAFCLFCAYPKNGFTQDATESVVHICSAHSKMVAGAGKGVMADVLYKSVERSKAM
jgi:hypothetical protein